MMDPVSFLASVIALTQATFTVIEYLQSVHEGGKQRFKLLAEVTSLWNVLDNLETTLTKLTQDEIANAQSWSQPLTDLSKPESTISQCRKLVEALKSKLGGVSRSHKLVRALKWPFDKQEAQACIDQTHRLQTTITLALSQSNLLLSKEIYTISTSSNKLLLEQERRELWNWLSPLDYGAYHANLQSEHCPGTGDWFLKHKSFVQWKAAEESRLWAAGLPGAGKTMLASNVLDSLVNRDSEPDTTCIYIFCRFDDDGRQDVRNLIGVMIKQVLRSHTGLPEKVTALREKHKAQEATGELKDLYEFLKELLYNLRKVYIIIDGVDEMASKSDLKALLKYSQNLHASAHLLVFSREVPELKMLLRPIHQICNVCGSQAPGPIYQCKKCLIDAFTVCNSCYSAPHACPQGHSAFEKLLNGDFVRVAAKDNEISEYVQWRFTSSEDLDRLVSKKEGLRWEVVNAIIKSAQSMFLLAKLIVDNLAACLTVRELKRSLSELPQGLDSTYDITLSRIDKQSPARVRLAHRTLQWVLTSQDLLACNTLEQAVAIDDDVVELDLDDIVAADTLISLCAGLLTIDSRNYVRWVHYSAEEYFKQKKAALYGDMNSTLARSCLTFLLLDDFASGSCSSWDEMSKRRKVYPFYPFAGTHWTIYTGNAGEGVDQSLITRLLRSKPHREAVLQMVYAEQLCPADILPIPKGVDLHYAVIFGQEIGLRTLLGQDRSSIDLEDGAGATPLILAAREDQSQILKYLLECGAILNMRSSTGDTALHVAIEEDAFGCAQTLLCVPGFDVNIRHGTSGNTPLMEAAELGRAELLRLLLKHPDIQPNARNDVNSLTAIQLACVRDQRHAANLLAAVPGIDFDNVGGKCPPLYQFARDWHDKELFELIAPQQPQICGADNFEPLPRRSTADLQDYHIPFVDDEAAESSIRHSEIYEEDEAYEDDLDDGRREDNDDDDESIPREYGELEVQYGLTPYGHAEKPESSSKKDGDVLGFTHPVPQEAVAMSIEVQSAVDSEQGSEKEGETTIASPIVTISDTVEVINDNVHHKWHAPLQRDTNITKSLQSCLKPPRYEPFPEDNNFERPGVAPLRRIKDIPPNARWTRISKSIVSRKVLEQAQERFDEYKAYFVVLRVLRKDEMDKMVSMTKDISHVLQPDQPRWDFSEEVSVDAEEEEDKEGLHSTLAEAGSVRGSLRETARDVSRAQCKIRVDLPR